MILATLLQHGDGRMELSYFWSAILIVALPMAVFGTLGYLVWKGSRRRDEGSTEQGAVPPGAASGSGSTP